MLLCNQWKLQDASDFVSYGNGRHTVGTIGFNLGSRKRAATLKGEGISSRLGNRPSEKTGRVWLCVCLCARVCGCRNKHQNTDVQLTLIQTHKQVLMCCRPPPPPSYAPQLLLSMCVYTTVLLISTQKREKNKTGNVA